MPSRTDPVESLVVMVLEAVTKVRQAPNGQRLMISDLAKKSGMSRLVDMDLTKLGEVPRAAWWFLYNIAETAFEPKGLWTRSAEDLASALLSYLEYPAAGRSLAKMLLASQAPERIDLTTIVVAGEAVSHLRKLDPYMTVAGPGVESCYTQWQHLGASYGGPAALAQVLEHVENVVNLALSDVR